MSVKLLTEHHLEFLSLKRGCTGSSESTLVKMPHCWKSHVVAQMECENDINQKQTTTKNESFLMSAFGSREKFNSLHADESFPCNI